MLVTVAGVADAVEVHPDQPSPLRHRRRPLRQRLGVLRRHDLSAQVLEGHSVLRPHTGQSSVSVLVYWYTFTFIMFNCLTLLSGLT